MVMVVTQRMTRPLPSLYKVFWMIWWEVKIPLIKHSSSIVPKLLFIIKCLRLQFPHLVILQKDLLNQIKLYLLKDAILLGPLPSNLLKERTQTMYLWWTMSTAVLLLQISNLNNRFDWFYKCITSILLFRGLKCDLSISQQNNNNNHVVNVPFANNAIMSLLFYIHYLHTPFWWSLFFTSHDYHWWWIYFNVVFDDVFL